MTTPMQEEETKAEEEEEERPLTPPTQPLSQEGYSGDPIPVPPEFNSLLPQQQHEDKTTPHSQMDTRQDSKHSSGSTDLKDAIVNNPISNAEDIPTAKPPDSKRPTAPDGRLQPFRKPRHLTGRREQKADFPDILLVSDQKEQGAGGGNNNNGGAPQRVDSKAQQQQQRLDEEIAEYRIGTCKKFIVRLAGACQEESHWNIMAGDWGDMKKWIKSDKHVDSDTIWTYYLKPAYAQAVAVALEYAQQCNNRVQLPLSVQINNHLTQFVQLVAIQMRINVQTMHQAMYSQDSTTVLREKQLKQLSKYYCALR